VVAKETVKDELVQLFLDKRALEHVKWEEHDETQKKKVVLSQLFLQEKYEDGHFVKMKARFVADSRMQDRNLYSDYSSPTAKTRSVMTCLKLAAVKNWELLKLDVGGAFLCAPINEEEEVFMVHDEAMSDMCVEYMPEFKDYVRGDGKLVVKVNKAMYRLIQLAKL
jgi:hypothetical protein